MCYCSVCTIAVSDCSINCVFYWQAPTAPQQSTWWPVIVPVRSLIAETPHSNCSRLAFLLKQGSPLKFSTSSSCRRRLLKRKLKLDSSPKACRYLDLDWECSSKSGIGPLVTKEAESLEEPVPLTMYKYAGPYYVQVWRQKSVSSPQTKNSPVCHRLAYPRLSVCHTIAVFQETQLAA